MFGQVPLFSTYAPGDEEGDRKHMVPPYFRWGDDCEQFYHEVVARVAHIEDLNGVGNGIANRNNANN